MAAICGKSGKVVVGSDTVAYVESWDMSIPGIELSELTALGAAAKSFLACGLPGPATGTLTFRALDNSDTATAALRGALLAGTSVTLNLYESSDKYWTAAAYVTDFSQNVGVDGPVSGSMGFQYAVIPTYT